VSRGRKKSSSLVHRVEKEVDTVVSLGVGTRCDEHGEENVIAPILKRLGYKIERAKTNMGLGKITNPVEAQGTEQEIEENREEQDGKFDELILSIATAALKASMTTTLCSLAQHGKNDVDSIPKLEEIFRDGASIQACQYRDPVHGGALRPSRELRTSANWKRDFSPDFRAVIDGIDEPASVVAIFDNQPAAEQFLKVVAEADLGLSVNMSASVEGAEECCKFAGITRHSVGYSLGFEGTTEKLPNTQILTLATMCGHGMISSSLAKKMIDWVKEGRRTPKKP